MPEYGDGWFKVSRRIFDSSRWFGEPPETVKLLFFLIGHAQDPMNPEPGTVRISDVGLASRTGLSVEKVTESIDRLCSDDPSSRSSPETGGHRQTCERVPGGVRLLNFDLYSPGLKDNALIKAAERSAKATAAAKARWDRVKERERLRESGASYIGDRVAKGESSEMPEGVVPAEEGE